MRKNSRATLILLKPTYCVSIYQLQIFKKNYNLHDTLWGKRNFLNHHSVKLDE